MKIVCLDLEGVLIPEIWQHVAKRTGIEELKLTTREVKDYRELMERRVEICHRHGVTLEDIRRHIAELDCFPGAVEFTAWVRERCQLVILSDTFYAFARHFMRLLGEPTLLCHDIAYNAGAQKLEFFLRMDNAKGMAVKAFRDLRFTVVAAGDSYNDIHMLKGAQRGTFFRAPANITAEFPEFGNLSAYEELKDFILRS